MARIEAHSVAVDDRRWLQEEPVYRVYFWTQESFPEPPDVPFWSCEPLRLTGTSEVPEVLQWATENSAGRSFTVYAEVNRGTNIGLVHLAGVDPTRRRERSRPGA